MEILHAGLMLDKERKGLWKTGDARAFAMEPVGK